MPIINDNLVKTDTEVNLNQKEIENGESETSIVESLLMRNAEICKRLDKIEESLTILSDACGKFENKLEEINTGMRTKLEDNNCSSLGSSFCAENLQRGEDSYPNGSWLGDESKPELRIRCPISSTEMVHIQTTCNTPEKMALTLLDCLFDQETQATSNISGTGKHKKKRLNPFFIFGIQCHLISHFDISCDDWLRIKQKIDSKCRTAFRKKIKLNSMIEKCDTQSQLVANASILTENENTKSSDSSNQDIQCAQDFQTLESENVKLEMVQCIQATPQEFNEIKITHQIQVLPDGRILAIPNNDN